MKNDTITHSAINAFIADLADQYRHRNVINDAERKIFIDFFDALFTSEIETLKRLVEGYGSAPEDGIMIFAALCRAIGVILNDYSNSYSWTEGKLYLGTVTRAAQSRPYSKFTGEERHSLVLFVDGRAPTAFKNCRDDRLRGAADAQSHVVCASEALEQFARVLAESALSLIAAGRSDDFTPFEIPPHMLKHIIGQRQYAISKRTFAAEFAREQAARGKISFFWWCLQNKGKIEQFGL